MLFFFQYLCFDTCLKGRVENEAVVEIVRVPESAEPDVGSHQPELLQIVADRPLADPHDTGQLLQAAGMFHAYEPVQAVYPPDIVYD